jgi:NAD(P)-dependent dehydrogenase (short-subunit alcohol dehydrogenase family)
MTKKIVMITGTTRGLGRAMIEEFSRLGHTVFGCARSEENIQHLKSHLGKPHDFQVVDVSRDEEVRAWAKNISTKGIPDLLLNNAALMNRLAPLWEISDKEFSEVVDVNIKGVANVIRHIVPLMISKKSGIIINFSSGWGSSVSPKVAPYCTTKWAIEGLTRALSKEIPEGMAAIPFSPGVIATDMLKSCFGAEANSHIKPDAWAKKVVPFLLKLGPQNNGEAIHFNM